MAICDISADTGGSIEFMTECLDDLALSIPAMVVLEANKFSFLRTGLTSINKVKRW